MGLDIVTGIYVKLGTQFPVNETTYVAREDFFLNFTDWQGAGASIFIQNPLHDPENPMSFYSEFERFPPNLEDGDVKQYAGEHLSFLVGRFHKLRSRNDELAGQDRKDFDTLSDLFELAA